MSATHVLAISGRETTSDSMLRHSASRSRQRTGENEKPATVLTPFTNGTRHAASALNAEQTIFQMLRKTAVETAFVHILQSKIEEKGGSISSSSRAESWLSNVFALALVQTLV
jgi:hypothetical protein